MPVFAVDTQAVSDTAVRARTRISTIQTEVDGMKGDIALLQSSWTGGASDSMAACAADWHVTALQVQASLDAISQALDQSAVSYDDAETANSGRFSYQAPPA
ncbi:MAG: WXG100 family type VII secretion target [Actinomyces ruminicola]|uniref:ESAT-6-like protein n=1 Tax=Actinomyces ruminicola TaxID=332524 RepID=A0A1G9RZ64_9ACTO|nr:WXG100 family type VII secretion target [Actinomyces ruminicola]MBE6482308.1 WXG100 family type VII secretion target [Actinomyces ruminicola]SDM28472.1 WXG100 family type VII secretion target [Actinomyces ruminicola]